MSEHLERLQKLISAAGVASRRVAEQWIAEGRVTVDGKVATIGMCADMTKQNIYVDGKPISKNVPPVYILLYKPRGYISTVKDDRGRKTVLDLLHDIKTRVYPVGRLDGNTEGLLLLTNDGALMHGLLHPSSEVTKTYVAEVEGLVTKEALRVLRQGVLLEDGPTAPARATLLTKDEERARTKVEIIIHEGRNRQVRRMFEAVGYPVKRLKRTVFAGLTLTGLQRGQYRSLTEEEISDLYQMAHIPKRKRTQDV